MRRSLAFSLEQANYTVTTSASAEDALLQFERVQPDLVLLDIGLPGMDGLAALRKIQERSDVPVIFVTARRRELEQVLGLELGADDYVTKPFDVDILLARIRAVLRRTSQRQPLKEPSSTLTVGDLAIDPVFHTVLVGGRQVDLSRREFDLLHALAREPERVMSADELLAQVWGPDYVGESQVLYVHMRRLRMKLEDDPAHPDRIVTVRSVGYKLAIREL